MIDPEFWSDEKVGQLDYSIQLLFIGMWNFADDEGLIKYNPAYLRSAIFPYKDIPIEKIKIWQKVIEEIDLVFPYGRVEQKYAWIINFLNHQVINRPQPSKLPTPSIQNNGFKRALIIRDKGICHICKQKTIETDSFKWCKSRLPSTDHIIPLSKGGTDYPSNLKIACLSCNKGRGNKLITEQSMNNQGTIKANIREVKLSKDKIREVNIKKQASPALKAALDKVYKKGFNIYQLLNKLKKESKVGATLPEGVLLKVCDDYLNTKKPIENGWAWFSKVVIAKWHEYNAEQNIAENEQLKNMAGTMSIKDILKK